LIGERFLLRARQFGFALALLSFDSLLCLEFFGCDKLLFFERLLCGDLLIFNGALKFLTKVDVIKK